MLAREAGRPVKFVEDRIDNTTSCDNHASDRVYYAQLALRRDGTLLGLKTRIVDDYGAYLQFGVGQHGNALSQCVGPYRINSVGGVARRGADQQVPAGRLSGGSARRWRIS